MARDLFATGRDLFAEEEPRDLLAQAEPVEEEKGYFGNTFRRIGERATELGGQIVSGIDVAAKAAEEAFPLGGFTFEKGSILPTYRKPEEFKALAEQGLPNLVAESGERLKGMDFGSTPTHTWDEVKRHFSEEGAVSGMGEVLKYAGETGAASIPDMVFAVLNLPGYVLARSSEIGETRAANKGKPETDLVDIMEAAPFALGSAILERVGGRGIADAYSEAAELIGQGALKVIAKKAGKAAAKEAGTEFVQEGIIEYVGEKFGTEAEMNLAEAMERGVAGAVAGGIYGGAAAGSIATVSNPEKKIEAALQAEIDAAEFITPAEEVARKAFDVDQTIADTVSSINQAQSVDEAVDIATQILSKDIEGLTVTPISEMTTNELLNAQPQEDLAIAEEPVAPVEEVAPVLPVTEIPAEPDKVTGRDLLADEPITPEAVTVQPEEERAEIEIPPQEKVAAEKEEEIPVRDGPAEITKGEQVLADAEIKKLQRAKETTERYAQKTKVNETEDSLLTAAAKLGGLNIDAWVAEGVDPEVMKDRALNNKVFGRPAFRRKGGMTPDDVAEIANQYGYGQDLTANEALDLIMNEIAGEASYTPAGIENQLEREALQQQEDEAVQALDYIPTEYESFTEGMSPEQERSFHAAASMEIDPYQYTDFEEADKAIGDSYDNFVRGMAKEGEADAGFALQRETESEREQREAAESQEIKAKKDVEKAVQDKAQADEDAKDFVLTGSERTADVAAARGQEDIFGAKAKKVKKATEPIEKYNIEQEGETYDREKAVIQQLDIFEDAGGGDLLAAANLSSEERIQQAKDNARLLVKNVKKEDILHGVDVVNYSDDAAHLLAPIRRGAQEAFYVLVLDKDKKPISVIDHSKGGVDAASVYYGTVASAIADTEGGESVWLAHNHPSGAAKPSEADYNLTEKLTDSIESLGITVAGHIVFGEGRQAFGFKDRTKGSEIKIEPKVRKLSTPVTHREIRRRRGGTVDQLTSPNAARAIIGKVEAKDAVVLLNAQHEVITSVSLTAEEMSVLKKDGVAKRLAGLISATNASAMIIKTEKESFTSSKNMATFANKVDVRLLDYFYGSDAEIISDAERGGLNIEPSEILFGLDNALQADKKTDFSLGDTLKAVKPTLDKVSSKIGVAVRIINSKDIPNRVKEKIPKGKRPKGFAYGNKVYLVHDHLSSGTDAQVTLAHELKGHVGVNNIIENWDKVESLYDGLAERGGKTFTSILKSVNERNPDADKLTQIKEFIAIAAERRETEGSIGAFMRKVREFLKKSLNALGFKPISMTNIDLILSRSEAFLAGEEVAVAGEVEPQFSLDDDQEVFKKLGLSPKESKTLSQTVQEVIKNNIAQAFTQGRERAFEGIFDGLTGLDRAERALGKGRTVGDYENSGYVSARLATGIADTMHAVMHYGSPEWREGVIQYQKGSRGLLEIFGDLGPDLNNWLGWMAGHRAQELMKEGREKNLTQKDIDTLVALSEGKEAAFKAAKKEYNSFNKAMLDLSQEAGLVDPVSRNKWESEWYIPFYRQSESDSGVALLGPRTTRGLSHQTNGIKALRGGETATNDLMENILYNYLKLTDSAMKNMALNKVVENLEGTEYLDDESMHWTQVTVPKSEVAKRIKKDRDYAKWWAEQLGMDEAAKSMDVINEINKLDKSGYEQMWTQVAPTDPDIIRVKKGGKSFFYRVNDPSVLRAVSHIGFTGNQGILMKGGRYFKRLLTTGVTTAPDFILRNFVRDAAHAWAINPDNFTFAVDSFKGLKKALEEDADYRALMFAGSSFQGGYVHGTDPEAGAQMIRRALDKKGLNRKEADAFMDTVVDTPEKMWEMVKKGWQQYRTLGDKVENSNRLATFTAARDAGKPMAQSAFEAKDLMDYSLRGNWTAMTTITDLVPFLNARLQGLSKLGRATQDDWKSVTMAAAKIAAASVALAAWNDDDERYKSLPDWEKDAYWHFWFGDEHFRLPKPFELGYIAGTMPERMYSGWISKNQPDEKILWSFKHGLLETLNFNPTPQAVLPLLELWGNKSWHFETPIESMSDLRKMPQDRYNAFTSDTMVSIGKALGLSPKKLQHLWKGYTGTMGAYILSASDMMVAMALDKPNEGEIMATDLPVIKSFYRGDAPTYSTQYTTDLYDRLLEANQLAASMKERRGKEAREFRKEHRAKLSKRKGLQKASRELSELRKKRDKVIANEKLSRSEKQTRLNLIQERMNKIGSKAAKRTEEAFK